MGKGDDIFLLWHIRPTRDDDVSFATENKLVGVFSSEAMAEAAKADAVVQPGFRDWPDAFEIDPYRLDVREWQEGFITIGSDDFPSD